MFRSWGIEAATEIDETKIAEIPGFGRSLTDHLLNRRARTVDQRPTEVLAESLYRACAVVQPAQTRAIQRPDSNLETGIASWGRPAGKENNWVQTVPGKG